MTRIDRETGVPVSAASREIRRNRKPGDEYVWKYGVRPSAVEGRRHGLRGNHRKPDDLWWRIEWLMEE